LLALEAPVIEVHISDIAAREPFRRHSYVSQAAQAVICGLGIDGYARAINDLAAMIGVKDRAKV
jgi:3-dehydroquinate dehydratase-2